MIALRSQPFTGTCTFFIRQTIKNKTLNRDEYVTVLIQYYGYQIS